MCFFSQLKDNCQRNSCNLNIMINRIHLVILLTNVFLFSASPSHSQKINVTHCNGACPVYESSMTANRANIVIHHVYAAGINGDSGIADWLSYRLTKEAVGVASLLPRIWNPDRLLEFTGMEDVLEVTSKEIRLAEIAVSNNPYAGISELPEQKDQSARLAPMTSFSNTPYWSDVNNLSNMVPMPQSLRLGPWLQLEQRLNELVMRKEELYVITGPLFFVDRLAANTAAAQTEPAAYYKIVTENDELAVFVFPKDLGQFDSYCSQVANLSELERMVSIDFFPGRRLQQSSDLLRKLNCGE